MTYAIRMHAHGGPDALSIDTVDLASPGPGEVRIRQTLAGVNFVDIYHRTGLYPTPDLPATPGVEAVGVVEAIGPGVEHLAVGQRVTWAGLPMGGYAQARLIPAARLIPLPETIGDAQVAGLMLRGLTAHMLLTRTWATRRGDVVLVHAAAGGLGLLLTQWAKRLGATVIGTVGDERKAELALGHGLDHAILYRRQDFVREVRAITGGRLADVAFDGVGGETLLRTLDCVRPFGLVASVGQASGVLPEMPLGELGPRRSLSLARPSVFAYAGDQTSYRAGAAALFDLIAQGLRLPAGTAYPLAAAADAQEALETGRTTGAVILDLQAMEGGR